jgi:hypothetical protein
MEEQFEIVWQRARGKYIASLSAKDLKRIHDITTQDSLLRETKAIQVKYNDRRITRQLARINGFIAKIKSFSEVINAFVSSKPEIAALVWGSVLFTLEVCERIVYPESSSCRLRN